MSKASEAALGDLHKEVALSLKEDLQDEVPQVRATARAQAIAFLKNNNITADPATDAGLADLKDVLARKRASRKGSLSGLKEAGDAYDEIVRSELMQ